MSIKVISTVWEHSTQSGSKLLMLLALADNANDDGISWPGYQYLADKARVKRRQAMKLIKQLEASGEIIIHAGGGRKITNQYLITVGLSKSEIVKRMGEWWDLTPEKAELAIRLPDEKGVLPDTVSTRNGEPEDTLFDENDVPGDTVSGDQKGVLQDTVSDEKGVLQGQKGCPTEHPNRKEPYITTNVVGETPSADQKTKKPKQPETPEQMLKSEDRPKKQLMGTFLTATRMSMPHNKPTIAFWWSQMGEISHIVGEDVERGQSLIRETVRRMRQDQLSIASPKSIVNPLRALASETTPSVPAENLIPVEPEPVRSEPAPPSLTLDEIKRRRQEAFSNATA